MKNRRTLQYIDIMRAICAFGVFFGHFLGCFYGGVLNYIRNISQYTPALLLNDGRVCINMFCTIGGAMIVYDCIDQERNIKSSDKVRFVFIKRFLYLFISSAIICIISFFIKKYNLLWNNCAYNHGANDFIITLFNEDTTFHNLYECLKRIVLGGNISFSPQLWTMKYDIVAGSICILAILIAGHKKTLRAVMYLLLIAWSFYLNESFVEAYAIGAITMEIVKKWKLQCKRVYMYLLLIISLFGVTTTYSMGLRWLVPVFCGLFIYIGYYLYGEKEFFSPITRYIAKLGRISYCFYLTHFIVIVTLSSWLYSVFYRWHGWILFIILFLITFIVVVLVSYIYQAIVLDKLSLLIKKSYVRIN